MSFFFIFCILELAYVVWEPAPLYNDIVWLLNQDTCQLRYKSWILSDPFAKQFQKLYKVENLVDLVKQMSISCDLNMEGIESQADISSTYVGMQHGVILISYYILILIEIQIHFCLKQLNLKRKGNIIL